jgi:hypothetical protein
MGYRYYAKVTFPAEAEKLPLIAEALKKAEEAYPYTEVYRDPSDGTIEVSCGEASYGEIDITSELMEYDVPFDHYHSCDCESSPEPYTEYWRPTGPEGALETQTVTAEEEHDAALAETLLDLYRHGGVDSLLAKLEELRLQQPATIDQIFWEAPEQPA